MLLRHQWFRRDRVNRLTESHNSVYFTDLFTGYAVLKLLDGAGMIKGLEKYSPSTIRQRASSPKFQVFNMALMSALSSHRYADMPGQPEVYGRWVESAVGTHLLNQSMTEQMDLYYWREGNHEVDFVLRKGNKTIGIEVKSGICESGSRRMLRMSYTGRNSNIKFVPYLRYSDSVYLKP